jgi:hypothetical protein
MNSKKKNPRMQKKNRLQEVTFSGCYKEWWVNGKQIPEEQIRKVKIPKDRQPLVDLLDV